MRNADHEVELLHYWRTVSDARHIRRADSHADLTEHQDELDVLALHTTWQRLKDCAADASLKLAPPMDLDLTGLEAAPEKGTNGGAAA
jgi:hypothetical protein